MRIQHCQSMTTVSLALTFGSLHHFYYCRIDGMTTALRHDRMDPGLQASEV